MEILQHFFLQISRSRVEYFLMDGRTFLDFKISIPIHWHYKVWKSQDIFGLMLKSEDGLRVSKSLAK